MGDKQELCWWPSDIWRYRTKFSRPGERLPEIFAPIPKLGFEFYFWSLSVFSVHLLLKPLYRRNTNETIHTILRTPNQCMLCVTSTLSKCWKILPNLLSAHECLNWQESQLTLFALIIDYFIIFNEHVGSQQNLTGSSKHSSNLICFYVILVCQHL
jgi:hypothetical protein